MSEEMISDTKRSIAPIFVKILSEAVDVWHRVDAEPITEIRYRILNTNGQKEDRLEFNDGQLVDTEMRRDEKGEFRVAVSLSN